MLLLFLYIILFLFVFVKTFDLFRQRTYELGVMFKVQLKWQLNLDERFFYFIFIIIISDKDEVVPGI